MATKYPKGMREKTNSLEVRWTKEGVAHSKSFPKSKEGEKTAKAFLKSLAEKSAAYDPHLTLGDWSQQWYDNLEKDVQAHKLEESTYEGYKYTLAIIKDALGDMPLDGISVSDIEDGIDNIRKTTTSVDKDGNVTTTVERYSFGQYKKVKSMLGQIFNRAEASGKIERGHNPMDLVKDLRNIERPKPKRENYTEDELTTLYERLPNTRMGHAIKVCLSCGLRGQELLALKVEDIEPDGTVISVNKALKRGEKGRVYTGQTKSTNSDRLAYVPMIAQPSARYLRTNAKNGYIMPNKQGGHLHAEYYRKAYKATVLKTGIEPLVPHRMRHTFTTDMKVKLGIDDMLIMAATGHSDAKTMEGYAHIDVNDRIKAAEKYDAYINSLLNKE